MVYLNGQKSDTMQKDRIMVEAQVDADVKKVWEYYTDPDHITKWNFASEDWHSPWAENDLRVGGKYRARMETISGSTGFDFEGVYDEIIPYKKIVYTIADGRKVEILFEAKGEQTEVNIAFEPEKVYSREQQKEGWQAILNNFKQHAETQSQ